MSFEQFWMVRSDQKTQSILRNWLNGKSSGDAFNQTKMVKSGWKDTLDTSSLSPPLPTVPVVTADLRFSETFCIWTFSTNTPGIPWPFFKSNYDLENQTEKSQHITWKSDPIRCLAPMDHLSALTNLPKLGEKNEFSCPASTASSGLEVTRACGNLKMISNFEDQEIYLSHLSTIFCFILMFCSILTYDDFLVWPKRDSHVCKAEI